MHRKICEMNTDCGRDLFVFETSTNVYEAYDKLYRDAFGFFYTRIRILDD